MNEMENSMLVIKSVLDTGVSKGLFGNMQDVAVVIEHYNKVYHFVNNAVTPLSVEEYQKV